LPQSLREPFTAIQILSVQEELVMKLISLVTGGDDAFGCDYALVSLTSNLAQLACRRVAMLKEQKHMDDSLVESYFWDTHAEYFSPGLSEQETDAHALADMLERLPAVAGDWMEAPAEFSIPDSLQARLECRWMIVREAGVGFLAIPRHTSTYVYTGEVPLPVLEKVVAAA
jgi:hypothetical protein